MPGETPHRQRGSCKPQTEKPLALGDCRCEAAVLTAAPLRCSHSYITHLKPDAGIVVFMLSFRTQI